MRPHFLQETTKSPDLFTVRTNAQTHMEASLHYHAEIELHYVVKGEGLRFIGNDVSNFAQGEMVLIGSNLPHCWRRSDEHLQLHANPDDDSIVLHFMPEFLGNYFLNLPETYLLPRLFERAKFGMEIKGPAKAKLVVLMKSAIDASGLDKMMVLLSILKILTETKDYRTITASHHLIFQSEESEPVRLDKVCSYTMANYKREIRLSEVASIGNLNITSFCRYFKLITKISYTDFLIEIRINQACRYLIEDKLPVDVLCYECGFNNVSNFYRHFKRKIGLTPREYKLKHQYN